MELECSKPKVGAIQRLETEVAASNERFSYAALCKTDSQLLSCASQWPYEASNTRSLCIVKTALANLTREAKIARQVPYACAESRGYHLI